MKSLPILFVLVILTSCKKEDSPNMGVESTQYSVCNELLIPCFGGTGEYCLFGYKFGEENPFAEVGYDAIGPREPAHQVTYSFQEKNGLVNTHRQINLQSKSFSKLVDCAQPQIRKAIDVWASAANISFLEMPENSDSDIRFFVADIIQSGVGNPNFHTTPCNILAGDIVIQTTVKYNTCDTFYSFVLHEVGHALGLGHVDSQSIMNPDIFLTFDDIQQADKNGLVELYGESP